MITYNKYIDKIGIEFEGYWQSAIFNVLVEQFPWLLDAHRDGSLTNTYPGFTSRELITQPLNSGQINEVFSYMTALLQEKQYFIDDSVGLHFHMSFAEKIYGALCTENFYRYYLKLFEKWFPDIWAKRSRNRYCRASLGEYGRHSDWGDSEPLPREEHFKRQSSDRYHFINYQIGEHKTVEVRGYGGERATIPGLAECIQKTIDCIPEFIKIYHGKEEVIRITTDETMKHKKEKHQVEDTFFPYEIDLDSMAALYQERRNQFDSSLRAHYNLVSSHRNGTTLGMTSGTNLTNAEPEDLSGILEENS